VPRPRHLVVGAATVATAAAVGTRVGHARPAVYPMHGKTVLITGGNSGIGLEAAVALARGGARVAITARDPQRGAAAAGQIRQRSGSDEVELVRLDLASLDSVRACAEEVTARFDRLDVLIDNAGAIIGERRNTADGFELTIGANHLGPFLLTNLLVPLLVDSAPSRVVVVSSLAHRRGVLDLDDLMWERRPYVGLDAYAASKLANLLFSRELARRLDGTGVTASALHPGTIRSGFGRDDTPGKVLGALMPIARPFFVDAERGAATTVFCAADPSLDGVTGRYFSRRREARTSVAARDDVLARRLWDASADLVGLAAPPAPPRQRDAG
jgi:NAD(P)-dependent dehydrogenase (short-subunit alcohol dehydrogenase family)